MLELNVISTSLPRDAAPAPLDVLRAVAQAGAGDYVLLHSGPAAGYSVIGIDPLCRLLVDARGAARVQADENVARQTKVTGAIESTMARADAVGGLGVAGRPLEALQAVVEAIRFPQTHPMVGWLGFISYDLARFLEIIPACTTDHLEWPTLCFTLFRHYLVFDPAPGGATAHALDIAPARFDWPSLVQTASSAHPEDAPAVLQPHPSPAEYAAKVRRAKEYIAAGDIYQANLAQRWDIRTRARPEDVFRRLCAISPAPYAACLRFHDGTRARHAACASPELLLSVQPGQRGRRAVTRPIKGTRPRDLHDAPRDAALRDELVHSAKDQAELTMIVDLLRNDLGRVAEFGTVRVTEARAVEQHPTVWHTVATIEARLRAGAGLAEILATLCPGGSVTGAPKIRAMQIIEELEGFRRGLYCGNIGVIGDGGANIALNIAIRTILFQEGRAHVYAGGGIVADSEPACEYEETLHKAAALFRALDLRSESRL